MPNADILMPYIFPFENVPLFVRYCQTIIQQEDVISEISKIGPVKHCHADKASQGFVYVMLSDDAIGAQVLTCYVLTTVVINKKKSDANHTFSSSFFQRKCTVVATTFLGAIFLCVTFLYLQRVSRLGKIFMDAFSTNVS